MDYVKYVQYFEFKNSFITYVEEDIDQIIKGRYKKNHRNEEDEEEDIYYPALANEYREAEREPKDLKLSKATELSPKKRNFLIKAACLKRLRKQVQRARMWLYYSGLHPDRIVTCNKELYQEYLLPR